MQGFSFKLWLAHRLTLMEVFSNMFLSALTCAHWLMGEFWCFFFFFGLFSQWRSLPDEERAHYFKEAEQLRRLQKMKHPGWSCKENYVSLPHANASPILFGSAVSPARAVCLRSGQKVITRKEEGALLQGGTSVSAEEDASD